MSEQSRAKSPELTLERAPWTESNKANGATTHKTFLFGRFLSDSTKLEDEETKDWTKGYTYGSDGQTIPVHLASTCWNVYKLGPDLSKSQEEQVADSSDAYLLIHPEDKPLSMIHFLSVTETSSSPSGHTVYDMIQPLSGSFSQQDVYNLPKSFKIQPLDKAESWYEATYLPNARIGFCISADGKDSTCIGLFLCKDENTREVELLRSTSTFNIESKYSDFMKM